MQKPHLILALQLCPLDVWDGLELMRLIADIELENEGMCETPKLRDDVDFVISVRRDTNKPAVEDVANEARRAFKRVHIRFNKRFGTGWPNGCNDLWAETICHIEDLARNGKIRPGGILTFESDCVPLRPDWISLLAKAWEEAAESGKLCMGHQHQFVPDGPPSHINGNAIFAHDIITRHGDLLGSNANWGWDAFHGTLLLKIGTDTNLIHQLYRMKEINRKKLEAIRKNDVIPALFHGIKKQAGIPIVRAMMKDGTFYSRCKTQP